MREMLLSMLFFGVVVLALINLKPGTMEVVVKEVPRVIIKERVVVKEVVKETPVIYETVNHYHTDNRNVVYYQPDEPHVQRVSYDYYEPVKDETEVSHEEITRERPKEKPKVKMFFVDGIDEPLWVEGGSR